MKLFGQLIRTGLNIATMPLAVAKDVATLGGTATGKRQSYTEEHIKKTKEEAEEEAEER